MNIKIDKFKLYIIEISEKIQILLNFDIHINSVI